MRDTPRVRPKAKARKDIDARGKGLVVGGVAFDLEGEGKGVCPLAESWWVGEETQGIRRLG